MERKIKDILLYINSMTGTVSVNDENLERVNSIDIHIKAGEPTNVVIDMDTDGEKLKLCINGEMKWFEDAGHGNERVACTKSIV